MKNTKDYNKEVGKRVKSVRDYARKTQSELAEMLDFSDNYISMIERGGRSLSREAAQTIAEKCGVREEYLLCVDPYMTRAQYEAATEAQYEGGFNNFLELIAKRCSFSPLERESLFDPLVLLDEAGNAVTVSADEIDALQRDIIDFSAAWLTRIVNRNRLSQLVERGVKNELAKLEKQKKEK